MRIHRLPSFNNLSVAILETMNGANDRFNQILGNRVLRHISFWLVAIFTSALVKNLYYPSFEVALGETLILTPVQVAAAYLLAYYQLPHLALKRKMIPFGISVVVIVYVLTVIARILTVHVIEEWWREEGFDQEPILEIVTDLPALLKGYFFRVYSTGFFLTIIKLISDRLKENRNREILEKEKVETELKFLKAQIHPHFLFNTLNNLYALTLQKSDKAPETVLKLSGMMDYMLYHSKSERVPIQKEIELVRNYIDLEMLRYGERLNLEFDCTIDDESTPISPLVFLSLVENAFKHGASGAIAGPKIEINLQLKKKELRLRVFNTRFASKINERQTVQHGIGGANLKRQLELIYQGRYELETVEKPESYEVNLYINLEDKEA